jgi:hypothetical protein
MTAIGISGMATATSNSICNKQNGMKAPKQDRIYRILRIVSSQFPDRNENGLFFSIDALGSYR